MFLYSSQFPQFHLICFKEHFAITYIYIISKFYAHFKEEIMKPNYYQNTTQYSTFIHFKSLRHSKWGG